GDDRRPRRLPRPVNSLDVRPGPDGRQSPGFMRFCAEGVMRSSESKAAGTARLVSLGDEEAVKEVLAATVLDLWKVVNNLTRLRPSKRESYRVAIFGSARASPGTFVYDQVKRLAAAFAAMGCDIVRGCGPGLMPAANEGARDSGPPGSMGIGIELPFEQGVNPFVEQAFEPQTFF